MSLKNLQLRKKKDITRVLDYKYYHCELDIKWTLEQHLKKFSQCLTFEM